MRVNSITISNFKSVKSSRFDFDTMQGLWEITGPVGSGKTSIGEALLYGLFGSVRDKNIPDLITWGEKTMNVIVELESRNKKIVIDRSAGKGSHFKVTIDGESLSCPNKKDMQSVLEKDYYDVSKLTLETLCIISFNGFKSLATLNTIGVRNIMDNVFMLSLITDYVREANVQRVESSSKLARIRADMKCVETKKDTYDSFKNTSEKKTYEDLKTYKIKIDELRSRQAELQSETNRELETINSKISETDSKISVIVAEGKRLKNDIAFLEKGVCPTCGAKLDSSKLDEYKCRKDECINEYNGLNEMKKKFLQEKTEAQNRHSDELKAISNHIIVEMGKIKDAEAYLRNAKICETNISQLENEYKELVLKSTDAESEYSEWDDLCSTLEKDVRHKVISTIVPVINSKISKYVARLGCPYDVEFDDTFKCTIKVSGIDKEVPIGCLSTGQLKTIDIIIILSILDVLMNSVDFNVHFLDELLSNMHEELREQMCSILRNDCKEGQVVFLISHASLPTDLLDGTIHLNYQNKESEIIIK